MHLNKKESIIAKTSMEIVLRMLDSCSVEEARESLVTAIAVMHKFAVCEECGVVHNDNID
jgi:uncharacterized Zn finger protein